MNYLDLILVSVVAVIFIGALSLARFASINDDKPQLEDEADAVDLESIEEETQRRLIATARKDLASAREEFNRAAREYCVAPAVLAAQPKSEPVISAYETARAALRRWGINEPPITGETVDVKV